ncbi:MAG TPA: MFS transporter [Vicinamibacterales bacterium]|nr:MFS transporter [Vicinamibacterales bacterium]
MTQGISFHRPVAFWTGATFVTLGVLAHLPDYIAAGDMHFHMAGMPMGRVMIAGMFLVAAGMVLATWGLLPPASAATHRTMTYQLRAIDDATLTGAHWGLLFVLGVALVIDVMKPATLGFVIPGMSSEYGITSARTAWLLICALTGTTLGSVLWGIMADRLGRRAAILLASLMFIGTAICGAMPSFAANLLMCFLMGLAAGGMLPIVYALMAESVPAKSRGWLVVLHGGMGTVGGTLAAAGFAALLEPSWSWRALWLMNLPTGILMLILNRWIPESPRYLLDRGRVDEARAVMARYGVVIELGPPAVSEPKTRRQPLHWNEVLALFRRPFRSQTLVVLAYGLAWGIVNWGFISFLPTFLRGAGFSAATSSYLLFLSAIVAIPGTVLVAYAYGMWSSRRSMIVFALASIVCALGLAWIAPSAASNRAVIVGMLALLYAATGGVIAMLSPYTAEVFPTRLRGTGSGLSAGSSKLGGLLGAIGTVTGVISVSTGMMRPALLVSIPLAVAAIAVAARGLETRGRPLEELVVEEPQPVPQPIR